MNLQTLDTAQLIALAGALGWASGVRLYLVVLLTGWAGVHGLGRFAHGLAPVGPPGWCWVPAASWCSSNFLPTRCPGCDSLWDMVHTVIRIPAGAALAAGVFGADYAAMGLVAAVLGGSLAATSHVARKRPAARRINTSPEPFTNIGASLVEDGAVPLALWLSMTHPLFFAAVLVRAAGHECVADPHLLALLRTLFSRLTRIFSGMPDPGAPPAFRFSKNSSGETHHV